MAELATVIEEVTGYPAGAITEDKRFRDDLGLDSIHAVEIAALMEDTFSRRVTDTKLDGLNTVADAINLLLCHDDSESTDFDAPTDSTGAGGPGRTRRPRKV